MITADSFELPVLYVDDDPQLLRSISTILRSSGIKQVLTLQDSRLVLPFLTEQAVSMIVLDLRMPYISGQALLERITTSHPDIPVIIMTATDELSTAVECMKIGAFDYLVKPVERSRLIASVNRAIEVRALRDEVLSLKERLLSDKLSHKDAFKEIITHDKAMLALFRYIEAIGASQQPVLITGETGTGKEFIAKSIHQVSRPTTDFVAVNVAGLDDNVFSDTLFGHKKGAFTGADQNREGLIATAGQGTLFLDEIGDLKETSQVKLLRLLQENKYYPLGADQPKSSNARIVVATNCDIVQLVNQGRFRKDLFYRLRGHHIHIPALRERQDDLPLLINHFVEKSARSLNKPIPVVPPVLHTLFKNYRFPGNVRELEAMIHDAIARHQKGILGLTSFREAIRHELPLDEHETEGETPVTALVKLFTERLPTLREAEQFLIREALQRAEGNQGIAAGILGLTRQALNKRLIRSRY